MKIKTWLFLISLLVLQKGETLNSWVRDFLVEFLPGCGSTKMINGYLIQYQIKCDNVLYDIDGGLTKKLTITCRKSNMANFSSLPRIRIKERFEEIHIIDCISLHFTFQQLLDYINVDKNFESLTINDNREHIWSELKKYHFQNLTQLSNLHIEVNAALNLTKDFFVEMRKLSKISIESKLMSTEISAFSSLPKLKHLKIKAAELERLPIDLCTDCKNLEVLELDYTIFQNANLIKYKGLGALLELSARSIGLNELQLNNLPKLEKLNISKNNFSSFSNNSLRNVPRLQTFVMNENIALVKTIPCGFFGDLNDLGWVEMRHSNIENIEEGVFGNSPNIKHIDLSGNSLRTIPENIFEDQFNLDHIDFSRNKLFQFSSYLPGYTLIKIDLAHNDLHHLNLVKTRIIRSLNASYNKLDEKSINNWIHNVDEINMSHNNINVLSIPRSNYSQIGKREKNKTLNMSFNKISKITLDSLYNMSELSNIDLSNNIITLLEAPEDIAQHDFPGFSYPEKVILENNPFDCDCRYLNMIRSLKKMPKLYDLLGENVCHLPLNLRGRTIKSMEECDLICNIDDLNLCPRSCWCIYRACDNTNIIKCITQNVQLPLRLHNHPYNIELILEKSSLISISQLGIDRASFAKITKINLANNKISELAESDIPDNITLLDLKNNLIGYISDEVVKKLKSPLITSFSISGNPIICDCKNREFLTFLQGSILNIPDYYEIECINEKNLLSSIDAEQLCSISSILLYTLATLMVTVMILLILGLLYYKYQMEVKVWLFTKGWFINWITEEEVDKDKTYDAFLAWSHKDDDFVLNKFLPMLEEGPNPFKICVHFRDWNPGEFITSQINRTIMESRRTIVILSPNFLTSAWGMYEFRQAHCLSLIERRDRLIVICYGDIGPRDKLHKDVQAYLANRTYLEWEDPLFWKKLMFALPHPTPKTTTDKTVIYRSGLVEFQRRL